MMRWDRDYVLECRCAVCLACGWGGLGTELDAERGLAVGGLSIEGLGIAAAFHGPDRKYHVVWRGLNVWLLACNNNELRREMSSFR